MSVSASQNPQLGRRQRDQDDALQQGARKKPTLKDPLVSHGRHFGRTVYSFCNIRSLIANGLQRMSEGIEDEDMTARERREDSVFRELLKLCAGLQERFDNATSTEEVDLIAELIQRGANGARADDTKGLKAAIIDWITPEGQSLDPPLNRKHKVDRGFKHERTGSLLCPTGVDWSKPEIKEKLRTGEMQVRGDQWPHVLYADLVYDRDDPWVGLLRNQILVSAYKHVFTSPSSVDEEEPRATRSGNARIHGMTAVTKASIAYIATQVRFALSSASIFSRSDTITDSERFYNSVYDLLHDEQDQKEVCDLLAWWNRKIFPHEGPETELEPIEGSALDRIRQRRAERLAQAHDV